MVNKAKIKLPPVGHICLIVKDADKTMEYYSSIFGIGPWRVKDADYKEVMLRGKKTSYKARIAFAETEGVELELIQPVSGKSLYSEFLDEVAEAIINMGYFVSKEQ